MWCNSVIASYEDRAGSPQERLDVDWVDIEWYECGRVLKKQSRAGQSVRVLLPAGQVVRHNDVIQEEPGRITAIFVRPCEVIVAKTLIARDMARLALELGNLHLPVQIGTAEIVFVENDAAMKVLESMRIPWQKRTQRFEPQPISSIPTVEVSSNLRVVIRPTQRAESHENAASNA